MGYSVIQIGKSLLVQRPKIWFPLFSAYSFSISVIVVISGFDSGAFGLTVVAFSVESLLNLHCLSLLRPSNCSRSACFLRNPALLILVECVSIVFHLSRLFAFGTKFFKKI